MTKTIATENFCGLRWGGGGSSLRKGAETWTINLGDVSDQKKPSQTGALDRVPPANEKNLKLGFHFHSGGFFYRLIFKLFQSICRRHFQKTAAHMSNIEKEYFILQNFSYIRCSDKN